MIGDLVHGVCRFCNAGFYWPTARDYCGMERCELKHCRARIAELEAEVERLRYYVDSNALEQGLDWREDLFLRAFGLTKRIERALKLLDRFSQNTHIPNQTAALRAALTGEDDK